MYSTTRSGEPNAKHNQRLIHGNLPAHAASRCQPVNLSTPVTPTPTRQPTGPRGGALDGRWGFSALEVGRENGGGCCGTPADAGADDDIDSALPLSKLLRHAGGR